VSNWDFCYEPNACITKGRDKEGQSKIKQDSISLDPLSPSIGSDSIDLEYRFPVVFAYNQMLGVADSSETRMAKHSGFCWRENCRAMCSVM
ncbi:MAG: hypothetical protein D3925_15095, partial [Candidatus Electrothrix sp. AR5]|nr:hypothetical protein [Candidatus Electrothrix sp. AR5]